MKSLLKAGLLLCFSVGVFSSCSEKNHSGASEGQTLKSIIGRDDRRATDSGIDNRLSNKVGWPQKPNFNNGVERSGEGCTATMISQRHAITAAHCLHHSSGSYVNGIYFVPAMKTDNDMPHGRFHVIKSYFPRSYNSSSRARSNSENDIAIIEFGANSNGRFPGDYVGYMSYLGQDRVTSDETLTIGYPGDRSESSHVQHYQTDCRSVDVNGHMLEFDCDATQGQSGGPLIGYSESRNRYYIYGVISSSFDHRNYGTQLNINRHRIVEMILSGSFSSQNSALQHNEEWVTQDHRMSVRTVNMLFRNNCSSRDLQLAIHYQQMGTGNWVTTDLIAIPSGQTGEIARSENGSYYVAATTDRGRSWLTRADHSFHVSNVNRDLGFQRINVSSYGDHIQSFNCN